MKIISSATGTTGHLIPTCGEYFFRVYNADKTFTDYDLLHSDLEVTIIDPDAAFYETKNGPTLDHSPATLGLDISYNQTIAPFTRFQQTYNEAIAEIQACLEDPKINQLTHWLLTTDANPYSFLPPAWGESLASTEQFVKLLNKIKQAVDNQQLALVKVNQEPRIVFTSPTDPDLMDKSLTPFEQDMRVIVRFGHPGTFTIEVLDIDPNQFGMVYDTWFKQWLQQSCATDAKTHGAEFAKIVYSKYQLFEESWITNRKV